MFMETASHRKKQISICIKDLESCQTGFTSRWGITSVAFKIFATATASQILKKSKAKKGKRKHDSGPISKATK